MEHKRSFVRLQHCFHPHAFALERSNGRSLVRPPALDSREFLSVLMESAVNPHLEPGRESGFTAKNYFMIARNFCNLQSRFGYHFTTVEALVGPRGAENYIRFVFTGGAADAVRRTRRAFMVRDILERFDFQVKVIKDSLRASLEGFDQKEMENRLTVVGHLLIHTRQLDMIMSNSAQVNYYKNKILEDLSTIQAVRNEQTEIVQ
ncbi:MAG: hypothetical protein ACOC0U_06635 [Desulfovibrionales bacterium]